DHGQQDERLADRHDEVLLKCSGSRKDVSAVVLLAALGVVKNSPAGARRWVKATVTATVMVRRPAPATPRRATAKPRQERATRPPEARAVQGWRAPAAGARAACRP